MASDQMDSGELILYETKAHVFEINPETKSTWLAKREYPINISFVAKLLNQNEEASPRQLRELRIVGADSKSRDILLNSIIGPKTTFTNRSQKFGQWIDAQNHLYGLGFQFETELSEFMLTFTQLQQELPTTNNPNGDFDQLGRTQFNSQQDIQPRQNLQQKDLNNSERRNSAEEANSLVLMQRALNGTATSNGTGVESNMSRNDSQADRSIHHTNNHNTTETNSSFNDTNNNPINRKTNLDTTSTINSSNDWSTLEQLRYENERLKQALEENAKNAGAWNKELVTLRTNNVKLTQALQESKSNAILWERELDALRDENRELKEQRSSGTGQPESGSDVAKIERELEYYKNCVEELQNELKGRDEVVQQLKSLKLNQTADDDEKSDQIKSASAHLKEEINAVSARLHAKIEELADVQKDLAYIAYTFN